MPDREMLRNILTVAKKVSALMDEVGGVTGPNSDLLKYLQVLSGSKIHEVLEEEYFVRFTDPDDERGEATHVKYLAELENLREELMTKKEAAPEPAEAALT